MSRLLPLLALAFVPALVAAPAPRDTRPAFGASGVLTRADLEQVRFDSRAMKPGDEKEQAEEKPARDEVDEVKRSDEPEKPRPANKFDVAVHMPWTVFREGEPVPAYLVLRNNRNALLGLTSRIDLSGTFPEMQGGAASFDVRDLATGKSVLVGHGASTNCGGGSLIDVPADSYFVTRGDLARLCGGLKPGDYEVEWSYRPFRSAPVRFSVTKSDTPRAPAAKPDTVHHFYHVSQGFEREERLRRLGEPCVWRDCRLTSDYSGSMEAALAVGQTGAYVPDVRTIPYADRLVEAWVEWHPYREGDRVVVTLRAAAPHEEVRFDEVPELYLQIEAPRGEDDGHGSRLLREAKEGHRVRETTLATPLTIEARLPADWRERVGVTGPARVAVLVTSKQLEMPRRGKAQIQELMKLEKRSERGFYPAPVWSGTLRTDFVELQFPPPPPRATP
jgi:hypothetical protein